MARQGAVLLLQSSELELVSVALALGAGVALVVPGRIRLRGGRSRRRRVPRNRSRLLARARRAHQEGAPELRDTHRITAYSGRRVPISHRELFSWALPRLGLEPRSFERLGKQVRKRIGRRVSELELGDLSEYRAYLEAHPEEWQELDARCYVTISRFFRDKQVFDVLEHVALPALAASALAEGRSELGVWSAGSFFPLGRLDDES